MVADDSGNVFVPDFNDQDGNTYFKELAKGATGYYQCQRVR
jgi:hypothetical protein